MSMIASCKLMHLLEAFSTPWFLLSTPNNHHLVFFLLEMFNNIIQVKLSNYYYNSHFRALRAFAPAPRRWSLAFHATPSDPMDQSNTLGLIMKAPKASSLRTIPLLKKDSESDFWGFYSGILSSWVQARPLMAQTIIWKITITYKPKSSKSQS